MDDASTIEPEPPLPSPPQRTRKISKPLLGGGLSIIVLTLGLSGFTLWMLHKANDKMDDISFGQTAAYYGQTNDLLTPDVGVIQFLHKGYSITFNTLTYTPNGLELTGTIGNPLQIKVSSLNLKITARPPLYKLRDRVAKDPYFMFGNDFDIGSGQTTIPSLFSGATETFSMTIPNVKQTSDGLQLLVSFSGERYSY